MHIPNLESSPTIMIVDDEKTLRLVLCHAMQNENYQVMESSSGEECLFLCQRQIPNIILLDAMMPGMDGFTCCAKLHDRLSDQCPPILMITSLYDLESVDRAFAAGAIDFVSKPINWAILRQRVSRLLETQQTIATFQQKAEQERSRLQRQLNAAQEDVQRLQALCQIHRDY